MAVPYAQNVSYILAAGLILLLPGAAWLAWSPENCGWISRLADAVGISVGLTALTALAGFYLRISFSRSILATLYGIAGIVFIGGLVRQLILRKFSLPGWKRLLGLLLGITVLAGLVLWRLYQARTLVLPAWVDSVHHTLVVRLILEGGGLPATLEPYLPAVFSYHYGFHVLAALFSAVTASEPAAVVLWFGQVLNALVALSVFRLAMEIWADWRRAVLAALLVGFGLQMPAYYLTWGRYTLLTGLLVLPLAMTALLRVARQPADRSSTARAIILTAATALSHYTALLLLGIFTLVLLGWRLWFSGRAEEPVEAPSRRTAAGRTALAAAGGVLLASPWLFRVLQNLGSEAAVSLVLPGSSGQVEYLRYILYLLGPVHNTVWLVAGALGMFWALQRKPARPLAAWGLLLALLTLPWGLRLSPFRPDHMAIVLFLPAALLAADFIISLTDLAANIPTGWLRHIPRSLILLTSLTGLIWSAWQTRNILNPNTIFTVQADVAALKWVRANTSPDARFIINTTAWMGRTYRGVDGGYWLLPYTGRQTILPPVLYTYANQTFIQQVERWGQQISRLTTCDADFWRLVREFNAGYLYIRTGQGSLQPAGLAGCSDLVNVYRQGGVFIYEIVSQGR